MTRTTATLALFAIAFWLAANGHYEAGLIPVLVAVAIELMATLDHDDGWHRRNVRGKR